MNAVTDMSGLLDAEKDVENFIKIKVIDCMSKFNKSSDTIKYAITKTKVLFIYEKNIPNWAQGCEWPFDINENPTKFISQKRTNEKVEYLLLDTYTNEQKVVIQYC